MIVPSKDLDVLRADVRAWLDENTPHGWRERMKGAPEHELLEFEAACNATLRAGGLLAPHWPTEYGGGGFDVGQQLVVVEELLRADYPRARASGVALGQVAATIVQYGDAEHKRHLAAILDGEIWCLGMSEPGAGSDLASLSTRAVLDGDMYRVNGQKIWSSYAYMAQWCLLMVRTDPSAARHHGITTLLLDMSLDGVEVRPIRQASGASEFCEIFLNDVLVPVSQRIGPENGGWRVGQTTVATERAVQVLRWHADLEAALLQAVHEAGTTQLGGGRTQLDDPACRQDLARIASEIDAVGALARRFIEGQMMNRPFGPDGSVLKLLSSEVTQRLTEVAVGLAGLRAQCDPGPSVDNRRVTGDWMIDFVRSRGYTIAAGTSEIQRNIIGEQILGLPREPRGNA